MFRIQGFTLLELLLVLFIIGLLVALVGPRFGGYFEVYERHYQYREIEDGFRQLPRRARLASKSLVLPRDLSLTDLGDGMPPLALPEGWRLEITPPLLISPLGACSGARIDIFPASGEGTGVQEADRSYEVAELNCELKRSGPGDV